MVRRMRSISCGSKAVNGPRNPCSLNFSSSGTDRAGPGCRLELLLIVGLRNGGTSNDSEQLAAVALHLRWEGEAPAEPFVHGSAGASPSLARGLNAPRNFS